jgi:aspartate carbamoyltransferase
MTSFTRLCDQKIHNIYDPSTEKSPNHLITLPQDKDQINQYIASAEEMKNLWLKYPKVLENRLKNKILITVFYEPSTRTSVSFQSAMLRLGGAVIPIVERGSIVEKGESLEDTIRTLENYGDAIVLRHPAKGAAIKAAEVSNRIPIINGGDGTGEHPTQALLDIFTIKTELEARGITLDDPDREPIIMTFAGDLKNSRTVHSLAKIVALYPNIIFNYICPNGLEMPLEIQEELAEKYGIRQYRKMDMIAAYQESDIIYMTRIQKERFENLQESNPRHINNSLYHSAIEFQKTYRIDREILSHIKSSAIIMHPLPRLDEIAPEVDDDYRAVYFKQVENGVYMRMAILVRILSD